ncbi:MAG: RAMP superfamily CRISPR-associated protein [Cyanobacteria bacterium P01_E01_bin.42]
MRYRYRFQSPVTSHQSPVNPLPLFKMYKKGYGIIETLAPLHVGASAGEETGNLNLIFRDQFTRTGMIPGSSIRGRFRADSRQTEGGDCDRWYGRQARPKDAASADNPEGDSRSTEPSQGNTSEGLVKFEYASLLWLPIFCPGQPIVRVTSPALLKRYERLMGTKNENKHQFKPYSYCQFANATVPNNKRLFFNLGFLTLQQEDKKLENFLPDAIADREDYLLVVVRDTEIGTIHDMGLYRQSRVALDEEEKINKGKGFFNVEALPEKTILVFPIAIKPQKLKENGKGAHELETQDGGGEGDRQNGDSASKQNESDPWPEFLKEFNEDPESEREEKNQKELYFGGLESVGFGRANVTLKQTV